MCGIVGHLAFAPEHRLSQPAIIELNDLMFHRGPDDSGSFVDGCVSLAARRLSIIDLPGGDQPMTSDDGRYVIVFNGEIYNYGDLRDRLLQKGYPLKTKSDTEALLYSFIDEGSTCLASLNGMFAFAIWDTQLRSLFIARDRMGVKPLYYTYDTRRFFFSSELTPIYKCGLFDLQIDPVSIANLLSYWYICEPNTIFQNVHQLPPGSYCIVKDNRVSRFVWWQLPSGPEHSCAFGEACEELRTLLDDAVRLRLKADVPYGTFLSGGIDSGLITAIAARLSPQPVNCFSIGFKEKSYSELDLAKQSAERMSVNYRPTVIDDIDPDAIHEVLLAFDEPLANASYIPTYFLSKAARRDVTVVLTGDGGDELFGGYPTYQAPYYRMIHNAFPRSVWTLIARLIDMMPVSHSRISLDYRLRQFARGIKLTQERAHIAWREVCPIGQQLSLFREEVRAALQDYDPFEVVRPMFEKCRSLDITNQFMYVDLQTYLLNDHLRKVDRMSMVHSLEARTPFLDYRIVEFAMTLPVEFKVTFRQTKRILKKVASSQLPSAVINGSKKGLTSPISSWLGNELKSYVCDQLAGGIVDQLFEKDSVATLLSEHFRKTHDHGRLIWALLSLQVWGQRLCSLGYKRAVSSYA